ncbi:hydrogenase nickel incorporation protein HypB [Arthrobacter sp. H14]|uniref:hydrogenase nickel incorporation protein HypB n=1 Tax=Arthrobacter sp. H14 TaxID=1312959 RepID=UPI00047AD909|nr:hydrogenase nickel incorporation protein HypB [Arthrobacter sp. H14]
MCTTCGCSDDGGIRISTLDGSPQQEHPHPHGGDHAHQHSDGSGHSHESTETIDLEENLLAKNDLLAARNRGWLANRGIRAFNVMSSPGAGKTTLLVRTIQEMGDRLDISVIEGDQETNLDADRIRATGRPVIQINTGAGCHLDADMMQRGLVALAPAADSTLFIENVGNLVCPALFDLGETAKLVIISVTEGDDKPQKYPHMFMAADLVIINKSDLLPYVEFDVDACLRQARQLNPDVEVLILSATTGEGLDGWYDWLARPPAIPTVSTDAGTVPERETTLMR